MKSARILLTVGALLLLATAAFHGAGGAMVSGWLDGDRGRILRLLWFVPPIDWGIVALIWGYATWRPDARLAPVVWLAAIIPSAVALMLVGAVGAGFPGIWMLLGAVLLAAYGGFRMRTADGATPVQPQVGPATATITPLK